MLAALWAAVLVPATVNSRTHAHDDRTMSGFSNAMRTLSRRSATASADSRTILVPTPAVTDDRRRAASSRRARRRAVFTRLLVVVGVSAVAALVLRGPWVWVHLGLDVALGVFVVRLRQEAVREQQRLRAAGRARLAEREAAERAAYEARHRERPRPRPPVVVYDEPPRRVVGG